MTVHVYELALTTVGGAGVAVASGSVKILPGKLLGLQVKYGAQPATTDVTINATANGVSKTLLTLTNNNANIPMTSITEALKDNVGVVLPDSTKSPNRCLPAVAGQIDVSVAQGDPAGTVTCAFLIEH